MASRVMTSSSPVELCWAATWQRGRSSKCSAVNVSSHKIHHNYEDCNIGVLRSVCKHSYNSNTQGNVILTCCLSSINTFSSPLEYLGSDWTGASFSDRGLWILTSSQNASIPTHVHYSRCYCRFVFRDSFTAVKLNECDRHFHFFLTGKYVKLNADCCRSCCSCTISNTRLRGILHSCVACLPYQDNMLSAEELRCKKILVTTKLFQLEIACSLFALWGSL